MIYQIQVQDMNPTANYNFRCPTFREEEIVMKEMTRIFKLIGEIL